MMDDLISRQAAIEALSHMCSEDKNGITVSRANVDSMLRYLPHVKPEQKTATWLIRKWGDDAKCSNCGKTFKDVYDMESYDGFCRHCGTKMKGIKVTK